MDHIGRGIIAGFIATLILSSVFHPIVRIASSAGDPSAAVGWLMHFLVGTFLWGASFGALHRMLPGPLWLRGLTFGLTAWTLVIGGTWLLARCGISSINLGAPAMMLFVHVAYGLLLGVTFGLLDPRDEGAETDSHDHLHPAAR